MRNLSGQAEGEEVQGQSKDRTKHRVTARHLQLLLLALLLAVSLVGVRVALPGEVMSAQAQSGNKVLTWGANFSGQLGDGSTIERSTPVQVQGLPGPVVSIAGGGAHSLAATAGGVWAWGDNTSGQLGNDSFEDSSKPVQVVGLPAGDRVDQVAAGASHSLALTQSGEVWAWGWNGWGQLGPGVSADFDSTAVQIEGLPPTKTDPVVAIAAGQTGNHNLAVTKSGEVWAWGFGVFGQLGPNHPFGFSPSPVRVPIPSNEPVVAVAAGALFSLALTEDGHVWAWGQNTSGQLGDGSNVFDSATPVQVTALSDVIAIAAGGFYGLALTKGGEVWGWGANGSGQLGNGSTENSSTPVRTEGLTDVVAIAAGGSHSLSLTESGEVWAWGANGEGQLGDGSTENSSTPVEVLIPTDDAVTAIAGGGFHSLAISEPVEQPTPTPTPTETPTPTPSPTATPPATTPTPVPTGFPRQPGLPNTGAQPRYPSP